MKKDTLSQRYRFYESCFTQGKTKEEAMSNIKEVIYLCLENMAEIGETIPDKYTLEQVEVTV